MNKLLFPNGGTPLYGDDFIFLDSAQRDSFKGILFEVAKAYGGNLILGGCELTVTGPNFTVAEGYLMINYEICHFAGGTYSVSGGATGHFTLATSFDAGGLKNMANSGTQNTWEVRRCNFTPYSLTGGVLDYPELRRTSDAIDNLLQQKVVSSTTFTMLNLWAKSVSEPPVLYRNLRTVYIQGELIPGTLTTNSWTKITVIPQGFRPLKRLKSVQAAYQSTSYGSVLLDVFPNGDVFAANTQAVVWDLVSLDIHYIGA